MPGVQSLVDGVGVVEGAQWGIQRCGSEAVGRGDINITTGSSVTNGARLNPSTLGQGNAGSVNIHAGSTVSLMGWVAMDARVRHSAMLRGAVGNGGSINIQTGSLHEWRSTRCHYLCTRECRQCEYICPRYSLL